MAVRRESVLLELDDQFSSPMARAAAAAALLNTQLDNLNRNTTQSTGSNRGVFGSMVTQLNQVPPATRRADNSINTLTGRLSILANVAATIGPALVPIGAVALPAIVGLTAQVGAAALGVGTLVAAFQGVGDTLTALNDAALEPTADNLTAARRAMHELSPAAGDFVLQLQELRPVLADLRDAAAEGFFPGASEGLDSLMQRLPEFEQIFSRVAQTSGTLAEDMGAALASGQFDEFFEMLRTDAPRSLDSFARAAGNIAAGLADIFVAFGPLTAEVDGFLLTASRGFREFADGLSETDGFRDFVAYVRTNGPRVAEAAMAIGDALVQIVQAAAPLGGPALMAIEAFATAIAAIAGSDFGTPILTAVAALSAFNMAMGAFTALSATRAVTALTTSFTGLHGAMLAAATAATALQVAVAGAAGAGLVLLADQMDDANLSAQQMRQGLEDLSVGTFNDEISNLGFGIQSLDAALSDAVFGDFANLGIDFLTTADEIAQMDEELAKFASQDAPAAAAAFDRIQAAAETKGITLDQLLEKFPEYRAQLAAMGELDPTDWFGGMRESFTDLLDPLDKIIGDSNLGRSQAVADAIANIGTEALSAAENATALSAALDALLSPQIGLSEATDAFQGALRNLNESLAENTNSLQGFGDGAIQNREAVRGLATDLQGLLVAQAEAGAGRGQLARTLATGRDAIMRFGQEAGIGKAQLRGFIDQMGLTPRLVRTVLEAQGINEAAEQARALAQAFNELPRQVRVEIAQSGFPESVAEVEALQRKYDLTPKQVETILNARDNASVHIDRVTGKAKDVPKDTNTNLNARDNASGTINSVRGNLRSLDGDTATVTIQRVTTSINRVLNETIGGVFPGARRASGGYISGPGTGTSDSIPAWLSNGEYVIKAAAVDRYGKAFFDRLNAQAYARGGVVRPASAQSLSVRFSDVNLSGSVDTGVGMALMRGVARAEVREALQSERDHTAMRRRAGVR